MLILRRLNCIDAASGTVRIHKNKILKQQKQYNKKHKYTKSTGKKALTPKKLI